MEATLAAVRPRRSVLFIPGSNARAREALSLAMLRRAVVG